MEIKGHTVRVDDEVWERLNALHGKSMNEGLRALLIEGSPAEDITAAVMETLELVRGQLDAEGVMECLHRFAGEQKTGHSDHSSSDPREVHGVQVGGDLPKNARCLHCGQKFAGRKGATLCRACESGGHLGDPRDCSACTEATAL